MQKIMIPAGGGGRCNIGGSNGVDDLASSSKVGCGNRVGSVGGVYAGGF